MSTRKVLLLALKGAVSLLLIGWLLNSVGLERAMDRMATVSPWWFVVALALCLLQVFIGALRWRAVMGGYKNENELRLTDYFRFFYMAAFFNQALPSTIGGDAVRVYKAHRSGINLGPAVGGVLIDRVITVLALLVLVAAMTPLAAVRLGTSGDAFSLTVWGLLAIGLAGTGFLMLLDRIPARFTHLPGVHGMAGFAADIRRVLLAPRRAAVILLWSLAGHVNLTAIMWVLALGVAANLNFADALMLFPLVVLLQTLPISIAGWGVREGAMVEIFALVALPADAALAISLLFGIALALSSLPGGVIWVKSAERGPSPGTKG